MSQQLKDRTKAFGIRVIRMVKGIRWNQIDDILIRQIVRSATFVGANYRSALRARSKADFISKITIAEEESDETCYWLEFMIEIEVFPRKRMGLLLKEAQEITAILTKAGQTAKEKQLKKGV